MPYLIHLKTIFVHLKIFVQAWNFTNIIYPPSVISYLNFKIWKICQRWVSDVKIKSRQCTKKTRRHRKIPSFSTFEKRQIRLTFLKYTKRKLSSLYQFQHVVCLITIDYFFRVISQNSIAPNVWFFHIYNPDYITSFQT